MLTTILSALGLGGLGLGLAVAFIPGFGAGLLKMLKVAVEIVTEHPWQAACAALALWGAWERWDGIRLSARVAEWKAHHDKHLAADKASIARAIDWRKRTEASGKIVAQVIKEKADVEDRLNAALADSLRLRGPGRATALCRPRGGAGLPAAAGGPVAPGGPGDAPLAPMPDDEPMAAVPWRDLVERARDADANRTEVTAWREWYPKQAELLKTMKRELPVPAFGN